VQGEFVSNFSSYSAISVLDRERLDKQYAELLSGYYSDNAQESWDLGHLPPTEYIMGGSIIRTATGYAMQISITKSADKMTVASYSGTCTFDELDNLSGVRRASLDLLQKMGVSPREQARTALSGAASAARVNAQTALSQGIVAQRHGNTIETMAKIYEAASYDPSLAEAVTRANTMSATIRTGSIGENVRNDIAWRNEWVKILANATKYIQEHPPVIAVLAYDPHIRQGKIDYNTNKVQILFDLRIYFLRYPPAYMKMMNDLNEGLKATKRNDDWKLQPLSLTDILSRGESAKANEGGFGSGSYGRAAIVYRASLVNSSGKVIGNSSHVEGFAYRGETRVTNSNVQTIKIEDYFSVHANDITDPMTINLSVADKITDYQSAAYGGHGTTFLGLVKVMTKAEFQATISTSW